ncbi:MAG: cache domain-containing protein [bacterium]|nr:cache domain-containing protein [bacterium]
MLNRLTVKGRLYVIVGSLTVLFAAMTLFAVRTSSAIRDLGVEKTGEVMLADQQARIRLASHAAAVMVGTAIRDARDPAQAHAIIRDMLDGILYEEDKSGYFFVYEGTVCVAFPVNKQNEGKDLGALVDKNGVRVIESLRDRAGQGGGFVNYVWPKPGAGDQPKLSYAEMIPGTRMWIGTGVYLDNIAAYQSAMASELGALAGKYTTQMLAVTGTIFAATFVLVLYIAFGLVRALRAMIDSFRDIAEGEGYLTRRIEIRSRDEIAELAGWFNAFLAKLQAVIRRLAENSRQVSHASGELAEIAHVMSASAGDTSGRANNVASAAEQMSASLGDVATAMDRSATSASTVATAAEQMSATINEIARNSAKARDIVAQAGAKAESASSSVDALGRAAQDIGKVVETIAGISSQVNLLALNATIEAASAGEAGRGFTVVASEVKELANQTSQATKGISDRITNIQDSTGHTMGGIREISEVISLVNSVVATIAAAVEQQSAATREIALSIANASQSIQQVSGNIIESSTAAAEITRNIAAVNQGSGAIADSSQQVQASADDLRHMAAELDAIVGGFRT